MYVCERWRVRGCLRGASDERIPVDSRTESSEPESYREGVEKLESDELSGEGSGKRRVQQRA